MGNSSSSNGGFRDPYSGRGRSTGSLSSGVIRHEMHPDYCLCAGTPGRGVSAWSTVCCGGNASSNNTFYAGGGNSSYTYSYYTSKGGPSYAQSPFDSRHLGTRFLSSSRSYIPPSIGNLGSISISSNKATQIAKGSQDIVQQVIAEATLQIAQITEMHNDYEEKFKKDREDIAKRFKAIREQIELFGKENEESVSNFVMEFKSFNPKFLAEQNMPHNRIQTSLLLREFYLSSILKESFIRTKLSNKSSSRLMITNSANASEKFKKTRGDKKILPEQSIDRDNERAQSGSNLDPTEIQEQALKTLQLRLTTEDHKIIAKHDLAISEARRQQLKSENLRLNENFIENNYALDDKSSEANFYRSLYFAKGFGKSALLNTVLGVVCDLPVIGGAIGSGLLFTSVAAGYVWVSTKLAKFNTKNFILIEDYENIMKNSLISDEKKQEISRDAHARYEQAEIERSDIHSNRSNVWQRVEDMWLDQPEQLGSGVGLFFGFGGVVRSKVFGNTGKIWTTKERIRQAMLPQNGRIRFVPPEDYRPNVMLQVYGGVKDKFGNLWKKGPSRTPGEPFEWDVQLSEIGKLQLGWLSRDGKHVNVSLKGHITHR